MARPLTAFSSMDWTRAESLALGMAISFCNICAFPLIKAVSDPGPRGSCTLTTRKFRFYRLGDRGPMPPVSYWSLSPVLSARSAFARVAAIGKGDVFLPFASLGPRGCVFRPTALFAPEFPIQRISRTVVDHIAILLAAMKDDFLLAAAKNSE